ncbi:MAG: PD40 domain-containing protein [Myxococcales bacterium]|nr:PD40 domain-containing protein [Myxococcales bacterium]
MLRRAHAVAAVAAVAAVVAALARPAAAGDPERVWQTVESEHFAVHFAAPLADVGRRIAVLAERAHRVLAPVLDHAPAEKTHIVLIDDNDGANGFANVLPRNAVTLYASAPNSGSVLADHDDWLYLLFAHEYTHILHLDSIGGLARYYNGIFGKTWAPNQVMPRWIIEGLATYEESKRSSAGRTRAALFDAYLRVPVLAGDDLRLDEFTNSPLKFPRGNAAYLYGSHFLKYVFDRFGDDAARRMSWSSGSSTVPFGTNRQLVAAIGHTFDELYPAWHRQLRDHATLQLEAVERRRPRAGRRLSVVGEFARNPRYTADGRELWFTENDGLSREQIKAIPAGGDHRSARPVAAFDRMGGFDVDSDGVIVLEQTQFYRDVYAFQDLVQHDPTSGRTTLLTRAERARDPALSPDGDLVAYSKNGRSTSELWVVSRRQPEARRRIWAGAGRYDQVFMPAWSPDGRRLAFIAWRAGGARDLLVVDVGTGAVEPITDDRALDDNPRWSPDGRYLYFTSDRTGVANVFAHDLATRALWQVTNLTGHVFEMAVSPDSQRLAYLDFVGSGQDLYELALDPRQWAPARPYVDDRPAPTVVPDDEAEVSAPRPYRALETLAPRAWTAQLTLGTFGQAATAATSGADVAGLHAYTLVTTVELERGDVNVGGAYGYGGARYGLRAAASRTLAHRTSIRIDGRSRPWDEEILSGSVGFGVPVRRTDDGALAVSFDYAVDWVRRADAPSTIADPTQTLPGVPRSDFVNAGLGARVSYGNSRGYLYNLGPTEGHELSLGLRLDHPALGASQRALTVNWFWRGYYKLPWGDTPALAVRVAGATRVSDLSRGGGYGLGGVPVQDVVQAVIDSTRTGSTGYLRGYPVRAVAGNTFHLANLEYRHQLATIERGASTLPVYLRRVHLAGLVDVGAAYDGEPTLDAVKPTVGAALRLDTIVGYFVPGTFEVGVARGLAAKGQTDTWFLLTGSL